MAIVLFLLALMWAPEGWGFDITQRPAFGDGQWKCSKMQPQYDGKPPIQWGRFKECTFKKNSTIKGIILYPFDFVEPIYQRWQQGTQEPYHALRIGNEWVFMGRASVDNQITVDWGIPMVVRIHFIIWNEKKLAEVHMYNPRYPRLEEVKEQLEREEEDYKPVEFHPRLFEQEEDIE